MQEGDTELGGLQIPHGNNINPPTPTPGPQPDSSAASISEPASSVVLNSEPHSPLDSQPISTVPPANPTPPQPSQPLTPPSVQAPPQPFQQFQSQQIQSPQPLQPSPQPLSPSSFPPRPNLTPTSPLANAASPSSFPNAPTAVFPNAGDVVLSEPKPKKKLLLKILAIALSVIIIGGGIAAFFIISNVNRQDFKQKVEDLYSALEWVPYTGQCSMVVDNYDSILSDREDFAGYVENCRQNATDIQQLLADLKGRDNSSEYITLYNNLSSAVNNNLIFGEDLEYSLNLYSIWHNWLLNIENINTDLTEEEINSLTSPLLTSNNNDLINYVNGWLELYDAMVTAYVMADTHNYTEEYLDAYFTASSALSLYEYENALDIKSYVKLTGDSDLTSVETTFNDFYNYITEKIL